MASRQRCSWTSSGGKDLYWTLPVVGDTMGTVVLPVIDKELFPALWIWRMERFYSYTWDL